MKYNFQIYYLNNIGWIRIRIDPELLPGSGSRKIPSWIRFRNKSFRIHKFSRPRSGSAFNMRIRIQEGKWSMRIRVHSPAYGTRGHDIHTRGFFYLAEKALFARLIWYCMLTLNSELCLLGGGGLAPPLLLLRITPPSPCSSSPSMMASCGRWSCCGGSERKLWGRGRGGGSSRYSCRWTSS